MANSMSALKRTILASNPAYYWPLEDGADSTTAPALLGGISLSGTPIYASSSQIPGSDGALDLSTMAADAVFATVAINDTSGFQIEASVLSDSGVTQLVLAIVFSSAGTINLLQLSSANANGTTQHRAWQFTQNGADIDAKVWSNGVLAVDTPSYKTGETITPTIKFFVSIGAAAAAGVTNQFSHLAIYNFADIGAPGNRALVADGYPGETATARSARLCTEAGVQYDVAS